MWLSSGRYILCNANSSGQNMYKPYGVFNTLSYTYAYLLVLVSYLPALYTVMDHLKLKTEVIMCTVQNINKISCPTSIPKLTVHKIMQNHLRLESYKHQLL